MKDGESCQNSKQVRRYTWGPRKTDDVPFQMYVQNERRGDYWGLWDDSVRNDVICDKLTQNFQFYGK